MSDTAAAFVRVETGIRDVPAAQWDTCANPEGGVYDPFVSHAFLCALEQSGSATAGNGWLPRHLVLRGEDKTAMAVMPCYLKDHSQGEYVFDYGWADAYERAGGRYYPKLQASVPFTPVSGRRLLVSNRGNTENLRSILLNAGIQFTQRIGASSLHFTFMQKEEWDQFGDIGLLQRTDRQFHWINKGYDSFDDFLGELASRKRKVVRKERREALAGDVGIEWITGSDLTEDHWDAFFRFYMDTGSRKWGMPYLTRTFFSLISETMADRILLILCKRNGRYIAGALNFIGSETLFGRYWGCTEQHRFLHFETCYYQAMDFAIQNGLSRVEAGAQGEHKLARGYMPTLTYSAHFIADAGLREAVARFLAQERHYVDRESKALAEYAPFRKPGGHDCS